ncbi:hypothetical protein SAMN05421543_11512 [Alicyclobacillus macrosporangiidus]|uniref:Uncharacterized protein n=1 Tax=Alicyclobacillus macrosporangiidus TaxID=392015 RepID=A0A1I7KBW1_9BACL|nr:hypothetical protein SAMN05421543_11512 [Alicyclobacillus macrosporangiidus]
MKYELTFWGSARVQRFPRYRRMHRTYEDAMETAYRVFGKLEERGLARAAHPAIIYGPGCGPDGRTIC